MPNTRGRVSRDSKYEYSAKLTGKVLSFKPAGDEIVATFDETTPAEPMSALRARADSAVYLAAPERGFAVLRATAAEKTSEALAAEPRVSNAIPVMLDNEGLRRYFLPDEFTVQFKDSIAPEACEALLAQLKAPVRNKQRTPGYYTVGVPVGAALFESIDKASRLPEVVFAEPSEFGIDDALQSAAATAMAIDPSRGFGLDAAPDLAASDTLAIPTDTFFGRLWGLHNTGQIVNGTAGTADSDIDAPQAWDIEQGKKHVVCAVIDTGCDLDHPDLAANLLPRGAEDWDFADGPDKSPDDSDTHGTHVAGTIAARRDGAGVVGVAPGVYIMPLRVNLTTGMNQNRADAINYVAAQAVTFSASRRYVINCSWKMNGDHAGVRNAIVNAVSKNVVVAFAAGNANVNIDITPQYPAVYPEVIAVAATDQSDRRATFSNFGTKVDISAPGVNTFSTVPNNTHGFKDGTSMASPHVAGVAALIWSRNPDLSNAQVRTILQTSAENIDAKNPGFVGKLGSGRLNAWVALLRTPPRRLPSTVIARFPFPQGNADSSTGLKFVRSFPLGLLGRRPVLTFLTQQAGSERIYFLNPSTGAVLGSIDPTANDTIGCLAWDGLSILAANVTTGAGSINRINPATGALVGSIPAPPGRGEGMDVVGARIYYSTIATIFELNRATGAVSRSFPAPEGQSKALCFGRGLLFSGQSATGRILAFNPATLVIHGFVEAPGAGVNQAEGLGFDEVNRILYVANQSENFIYALRVGGI